MSDRISFPHWPASVIRGDEVSLALLIKTLQAQRK
jgi:hypothetical protein